MANLNFDMIASPNFVRFVYDGDGSDTATAGPAGSAEIEQIFLDWFDSQGLATDADRVRRTLGLRAVHRPRRSRPAGCSPEPRASRRPRRSAVYGGVAGEAYDRCYHQACDTISNLNDTAFDQMSDGAATALMTLAESKEPKKAKPVKLKTAKEKAAQAVYRGSSAQR